MRSFKMIKIYLMTQPDPVEPPNWIQIWIQPKKAGSNTVLERTYKPHYHYQNFSPLANGTDLNREKYAILQTHWH